MRVTRESNRRSLKGSRGVVTHPRNAPASFLESQRHAELDSSLKPRIALAQVAVKLEGDKTLTDGSPSIHEVSTGKADALYRSMNACR